MILFRSFQAVLLVVVAALLVACPATFFAEVKRERIIGTCFSADGRFVARSTDSGLAVFNVQSGESKVLPDFGHIAFSPDGTLLACGGRSTFNVWNWGDGRQLYSWTGHNRGHLLVAFSPDGALLAGADDSSIRIWNLRTGRLLNAIPLDFEQDAIAFSSDGKFIIAGGSKRRPPGDRNHEIKLWTLPGGERQAVLAGPEYCLLKSLAVSPDGKTLATGLSVNLVRLWDINARKELRTETVPYVNYHGMAFSGDGRRLAVSVGFGDCLILDSAARESRMTFRVPGSDIEAISWREPDFFLVAAGDKVYEVDSESGRVSLLRSGLILRERRPTWPLGLGFLLWVACWSLVHWLIQSRTSAERRPAERYAWIVVMATALMTVLHWAALLSLVPATGRSENPATCFCCLSLLWLPAGTIIVRSGAKWGQGPFGIASTVFCAVAVGGQLLLELYMLSFVT